MGKVKTVEIKELLEDYLKGSQLHESKPEDCNHWIRRFFRCYIDGSYKGEEHYKANIDFLNKNTGNKKKLKMFAVSSFIQFLSIEFAEISSGTIRNTILKTLTAEELERLNQELISDCLDLIEFVEV
ncbi:MAG: hypothetical protein ACUZ8I_14300 [Candidatus Scalindua sp.]